MLLIQPELNTKPVRASKCYQLYDPAYSLTIWKGVSLQSITRLNAEHVDNSTNIAKS